VILSSGESITYANQKFFEFFNLKNLNEFLSKNQCICEKFIRDDKFFHLGKVDNNQSWLDAIKVLPQSKSIVAMIGKDSLIHSFSVSINFYEHNIYILSFTDISDTMVEQIRLQEKTLHDTLTDAYNREYFEQYIDQIIIDYTKSDSLLALCMLDIDFFKKVNDTYGHDVGDVVLRELVDVIDKFSRENDILIRWGGEEFIILFKISSPKSLAKVLEKLRKAIEKHLFATVEHITCSLGSSIYKEGEDINSTIKRADKALYSAKNSGRNRVVIL
jgi:diguanylate cyclase (GGDEF)-like protein